jgi:hypothetical protein
MNKLENSPSELKEPMKLSVLFIKNPKENLFINI